jgi:DNA-binding response OmpR family regulator
LATAGIPDRPSRRIGHVRCETGDFDDQARRRQEVAVSARILVVEDDPGVAELVEVVLVGEGYTVALARDGADGLLLARDWKPDLILLDLSLPKLDGSAVVRLLKSEPETGEIPIVLMSAARTIRAQTDQLQEADAALAKPFDIEALLTQVAFHLARRSAPDADLDDA